MEQYDTEGRTKDAAELRKGLDEAKAKLKTARTSGPPAMDFRRPTPEMIADAKKRGIDLEDPAVLEMLEELQREQRETATPEGREAKKIRDAAQAKADGMSMRDLMRSLSTMAVDHAHCETKSELQALYVLAACDVDKAQAAAADAKRRPRATRAEPDVGSWKYTVVFATIFLAYRVWSMGLLGPLLGDLAGTPPDESQRDAAEEANPYGDADAEPAFAHHDWTSEF